MVGVFVRLDTLNVTRPLSSGVLRFLGTLPRYTETGKVAFSAPARVMAGLGSISRLSIPCPVS